MSEINIPKTWENVKENYNSHTTKRQRAAIAVTGGLLVGASVLGLKHMADEVSHDRAVSNTFSDPAIGERIERGEIDPDMFVPLTVMPGDTTSALASRFGNQSSNEDIMNLQHELSSQAGADGLQPGEVLYMPVEQLDIQRLAHN